MSRGGTNAFVFGVVDASVSSTSNGDVAISAFVPTGLAPDQYHSDVAAAALAENYEMTASAAEIPAPNVEVNPTAEQEACVAACNAIRYRDRNRAREDQIRDSSRCFRNFNLCLAGCTAAALAGPWAYLACMIGCGVYEVCCELDTLEDRDIKFKRIEEDYRTCLQGCGIIIAEI
jgi:hypothetical protein